MSSTILIKRSSTAASIPTHTSDLIEGELAVNLKDKKIYTANSTAVFEIGGSLSVTTLGEIGNVDTTGKIDNSVLVYNSGASEWQDSNTITDITLVKPTVSGRAITDVYDYGTLTANVFIDFSLANNFKFNFDTDNIVLGSNASTLSAGPSIGTIQITGNNILTFSSEYKFSDGVTPDLSSVANTNAIHYLDFFVANSTFIRLSYTSDYKS